MSRIRNYDKLSRRRFRNHFSTLPCFLLRKTNQHFYLSLRINKQIVNEYNTLKEQKMNLKDKADMIKKYFIQMKQEYKIDRYYTDIFLSSYKGHIKNILDD